MRYTRVTIGKKTRTRPSTGNGKVCEPTAVGKLSQPKPTLDNNDPGQGHTVARIVTLARHHLVLDHLQPIPPQPPIPLPRQQWHQKKEMISMIKSQMDLRIHSGKSKKEIPMVKCLLTSRQMMGRNSYMDIRYALLFADFL